MSWDPMEDIYPWMELLPSFHFTLKFLFFLLLVPSKNVMKIRMMRLHEKPWDFMDVLLKVKSKECCFYNRWTDHCAYLLKSTFSVNKWIWFSSRNLPNSSGFPIVGGEWRGGALSLYIPILLILAPCNVLPHPTPTPIF